MPRIAMKKRKDGQVDCRFSQECLVRNDGATMDRRCKANRFKGSSRTRPLGMYRDTHPEHIVKVSESSASGKA